MLLGQEVTSDSNGKQSKKEKKYNILYVDDEVINLRIFKTSFRRHYNVFVAEGGNEGLQLLEEEEIHVIISDQRMPNMTGTEFLEKTLEKHPDVIRIILTGFADIEVIVQAVNSCNIYRYITKPYDMADMKLTLDQAIESLITRRQRDSLVEQLSSVNKDLEDKVKERTKELEAVNRHLTEGLVYAQTVQEMMLPKPDTLLESFKDVFVIYNPRDYVGGDFFWFQDVSDDERDLSILTVVDCMGHGVAGAMLSMIGETQLNQIVNEQKISRADEILAELDKSLLKTLARSRPEVHENTMDAALIVLNKRSRTIEFCGAKLDLVYVKYGELHRVKGTRKSIGSPWYEHVQFESSIIEVPGVTELYLYSDGIQDQVNQDYSRKFGSKQLLQLLKENHSKDFEIQHATITQAVEEWKKDADQVDDITLMGLRL